MREPVRLRRWVVVLLILKSVSNEHLQSSSIIITPSTSMASSPAVLRLRVRDGPAMPSPLKPASGGSGAPRLRFVPPTDRPELARAWPDRSSSESSIVIGSAYVELGGGGGGGRGSLRLERVAGLEGPADGKGVTTGDGGGGG